MLTAGLDSGGNYLEKKLFLKNDIYLIAGLLLVLVVFTAILILSGKSGKEVVVSVDGKTVATFPLDEDLTYEIKGYQGGSNLLVISGGEAYLTSASCPDHLCINMGKISRAGQSIICLPNRVTVEIVGDSDASEPEYDAVTG